MKYDAIIVGGFGHVGLPLGITFADAGWNTALYDIDASKRPMIEAGKMPFIEYGAEPLLKKVIGKKLHISDGLEDAQESRVVVVTIGTPVDEYLSPKTKSLFDLADALVPHLSKHQCVLLRSTVYPGTTAYLLEHFRRHGCPVHVAYCPERIAQGFAIRELKSLPHIISGFSPEALNMVGELFTNIGPKTIEVGVGEAELVKLYLNAWRYMQFAAGNQFYMTARDRGLNYDEIYRAMTEDYERGKAIPRPGFAAGPCLFKDTMQLAAANRNQFLLGHAAMMVNEGLPSFLIQKLLDDGVNLRGVMVGILGMAFKAEIDDTRDSLSYKLRKQLQFHGATVLCSDEYVKDPTFIPSGELLKQSDIIFVGVPHKAYRSLRVPSGKTVVDLWGALPRSA